jgi:hypothetical protein
MIAFAGQLIFSFGLAAFLGLFVLWLRQPAERRSHSPYGLPFLYSAAWFGANLATTDFALLLAAAGGFPAILLHLFRLPRVRWAALAGSLTAALSVLSWTGRLAPEVPAALYSLLLAATLFLAARQNEIKHSSGRFLVVCIVLVPIALYAGAPSLRLFVRSLPLSLLLLDSYMRRRFLFFDLFVKWGLAFLISLSLLCIWFTLLPEDWDPLRKALLFVPLLWAVPRLNQRLGQYLDRRFLHRPLTPAEAGQRFTDALRAAPDEAAARAAAERELAFVFGAAVELRPAEEPVECDAEFLLPLESEPHYRLTVRRDVKARPFFSQDFELLRSLGRILALLLDNRRLEARRQSLHQEAARSELKALRAQINPHFLFNALNTVAGLIPRQPERAETVVERLADVFRYTLRRSESEWSTLGEELESVSAYLEVELARYPARLQPSVLVPDELRKHRIPSMTLLTLVENAIKHGVARSTGACTLSVEVSRNEERLVLVVRNGGPAPVSPLPPGHGLQNVRNRLRAHFGDGARFDLSRDEALQETVARVEVPAC